MSFNERIITNAKDASFCRLKQGVWDESKQLCWRSANDFTCANYEPSGFLQLNKRSKQKSCIADPRCDWVQNRCVSQDSLFLAQKGSQLTIAWPTDITSGQVLIQRYIAAYYKDMLDVPPPLTRKLRANQNRCINQSPLFSIAQSVVYTVFRGMATVQGTNRGLLAWHSTGSGKTIVATSIMDAFWDTPKKIIYASSIEGINNNPPDTFYRNAKNFFPRWAKKAYSEVEKDFKTRGVEYLTFAVLSHRVAPKDGGYTDYLKDAILIIDEVHNIFKPIANQRGEHDRLKGFLLQNNTFYDKNLKVAILTATPGDNPQDVVNLLNMVRNRKNPPIRVPDFQNEKSIAEFKNSIRGLISYFDMSLDHSRYPVRNKDKIHFAPMSAKQFLEYKAQVAKNTDFEELKKEDRINDYYKNFRKYSNSLYDKEFTKTITDIDDPELHEFSSKIPLLLKTISTLDKEKHYVYSAFYENRGFGGHGILAIARFMEMTMGYSELTAEESGRFARGEQVNPRKRYSIITTTRLGDTSQSGASRRRLGQIINIFNSPENVGGQLVHVLLASQGFNEGMDLRAVRHVHLVEPMITYNAEKQTIGRALRNCSHQQLSYPNDWKVTLHRYFAEKPDTYTINKSFNLEEAEEELIALRKSLEALEEMQFDEDNKPAPNNTPPPPKPATTPPPPPKPATTPPPPPKPSTTPPPQNKDAPTSNKPWQNKDAPTSNKPWQNKDAQTSNKPWENKDAPTTNKPWERENKDAQTTNKPWENKDAQTTNKPWENKDAQTTNKPWENKDAQTSNKPWENKDAQTANKPWENKDAPTTNKPWERENKDAQTANKPWERENKDAGDQGVDGKEGEQSGGSTNQQISSLKAAIKEAEKRVDKLLQLNIDNIVMIDEFIYNESRRRVQELVVLYECMIQASIDCIMFSEYHGTKKCIES